MMGWERGIGSSKLLVYIVIVWSSIVLIIVELVDV